MISFHRLVIVGASAGLGATLAGRDDRAIGAAIGGLLGLLVPFHVGDTGTAQASGGDEADLLEPVEPWRPDGRRWDPGEILDWDPYYRPGTLTPAGERGEGDLRIDSYYYAQP